MIELLNRGGWMMYLLLINSVLTLGMVLERSFALYGPFSRRLFDDQKKKLLQQAKKITDLPQAENFVASAGDRILMNLQKRLDALSLIARISPMMGLLGTVWGMVVMFQDLAQRADPSPTVLANGIWQALLTTVFGLLISLTALVAHHILFRRVERLGRRLKDEAEAILYGAEKDDPL